MLVMSEHDLRIVNVLKDGGILENVEEDHLDHENGSIILGCPDCDQFDDVYGQHVKYCLAHRTEPRIHPLTEHGGAAILSPHSKLTIPSDELMRFVAANLPPLETDMPSLSAVRHLRAIFRLWDLYQALQMKDIRSIVLYTHSPCGAARAAGMSLVQLLVDQVIGHQRVQNLFNGTPIQVVSFFHKCQPDGIKKTKRLNTKKLKELMETMSPHHSPLLLA